ncbi:MAG: adhesin [Methanobrevibacter sp.]|uniref:adhesin n=1 Tax=Methanobrevibacter sp. TaxID=66852 RepID=UPI0025F1B6DA|nr:adhesin [Methanobrevibacter sp.]MBQ6138175.1 adhesin [Methanobrevibacter sp.]
MIPDNNKSKLILVLVIILAIAILFFGYAISVNNSNQSQNAVAIGDDSIDINQSYPDGPTAEAKIDTSDVNSQLLGENDLGSVELLGPFGNPDSDIKIAYSIGMHPLESKVHKALFDTIVAKNSSLNYCYYIYKINVTNYNTDDEGRMDGQLLAQEFVAPHIINNDYDLFVDVHSNKGMISGTYEETNFVFAVGQDEKSEAFVNKILDKMPELVYYFPSAQSSPPYITLPTEQAGIPTVNYETYCYEPINTTYDLMDKFVDVVDNLEF